MPWNGDRSGATAKEESEHVAFATPFDSPTNVDSVKSSTEMRRYGRGTLLSSGKIFLPGATSGDWAILPSYANGIIADIRIIQYSRIPANSDDSPDSTIFVDFWMLFMQTHATFDI
jgi:hypothetical protein